MTVLAAFRDRAASTPDQPSIIVGAEVFTWGALATKADQVAAEIHARGARRVSTLLQDGVDLVATTLAAWQSGAVVAPLSLKFGPDEIDSLLEAADTQLVVGTTESLSAHRGALSHFDSVDLSALSSLDNTEAPLPRALPDPLSPAVVMFSSGSTGTPKRVTRTHANLLAEAKATTATLELGPQDKILCVLPLHHAHGFGNCFLASLQSGAPLVIPGGEFHPRKALEAVEEHRVTVFPGVPFMFEMINRVRRRREGPLETARWIFSAGAPLREETAKLFEQRFGVRLRQLYGSSETGALTIDKSQESAALTSVGTTMSGVRIKILSEAGDAAAAGAIGEICVTTDAMTHGYDGGQDSAAFEGGWFHTGDLGYLDRDRRLFVTGRKKLLINVAGLKVDPSDVENVILQIEGVSECVVVGVPDRTSGERIKAVVVADEEVTAASVLERCSARLGEHRLPSVIEFRDEIPRSPLGKILRKYLGEKN